MIQRKANIYRLYPDADQQAALSRIAGACRAVYNLALEQRRDWWRRHKERTGSAISFAGQCRELTDLRREVDWLHDAPIHPLQQALRDLDRAYQNFFSGRAGYPSPRRKGLHDSFRFPDPASRCGLSARGGEPGGSSCPSWAGSVSGDGMICPARSATSPSRAAPGHGSPPFSGSARLMIPLRPRCPPWASTWALRSSPR
jgi:putative transposase